MGKVRKSKIRLDRLAIVMGILVVLVLLIYFTMNRLLSSNKKENIEKPPIVEVIEKSPYEEFYYYNRLNQERYISYHELNPDLDYDTVVWQVNANLDQVFYAEIMTISDFKTKPLLVNKYYALPSDYVPPNLVAIGNDKYMDQEAYEAYQIMKEDAKEEGHTITIISAYRSYDYQSRLYNNYLSKYNDQERVDTFSARPGHSEHQTGLAIDICGANGDYMKFEGTKESAWIIEHAHEYGFIIRYGEHIVDLTGYMYEPWHLRYVGKDVARIMKENGIETLEEYIIKYVEYKGE